MNSSTREIDRFEEDLNISRVQLSVPKTAAKKSFDGKSYLGVVPFFMRNIHPRFLPAVPGISDFMEINLRTYVHDLAGVPGVWFYSLDANQWLVVKVARSFFHLPYEHAEMKSTRTVKGRIRYESLRTGARANGWRCMFDYAPGAHLPQPEPGSLEFFLFERYRLYSSAPDGLRRGTVFHEPYPLCRADVTAWDENLLPLDGFAPTWRAPDHVIMSRGVDVTIFQL